MGVEGGSSIGIWVAMGLLLLSTCAIGSHDSVLSLSVHGEGFRTTSFHATSFKPVDRGSARTTLGTSRSLAPVSPIPSWTKLTVSASPSARMAAGMTFDAADDSILLFGGINTRGPSVLNDTWYFSHGEWTNASSNSSPPKRADMSLTYDYSDGYVLLFGGTDYGGTIFGDTWTFHSGVWTRIYPTPSPRPRYDASMAYDPQTSSVVMFGGSLVYGTPPIQTNETWTYRGGNWTLLHPQSSPTARQGAMLTYDTTGSALLLFGGLGTGAVLNDSWTFSTGNWTKMSQASGPTGVVWAGMATDPYRNYTVLFGGSTTTGVPDTNRTWLFTGGLWRAWVGPNKSASPAARDSESLAYDPVDGYALMFGGDNKSATGTGNQYSDTWAFGLAQVTILVTPANIGRVTLNGSVYGNGSSVPFTLGVYAISHSVSPWARFLGWQTTGDVSVNPFTSRIEIQGNGTVTAIFRPVDRVDLLSSLPSTCPGIVFNGTPENSTAELSVLEGGYPVAARACPIAEFIRWLTTSGVQVANPTSSSTNVTVSGNGTLLADYGGNVTLIASPASDGSIQLNGTQYPSGTSLALPAGNYSILAVAQPWARFLSWGWTTPSLGVSQGTLKVGGNGALTARFGFLARVGVGIEPSRCGPISLNGTPLVSGAGLHLVPDVYALSAPACSGFAFSRWVAVGNVSVASAIRNSTQLSVAANGTVEARYLPLYTVEFSVTPAHGGNISFGGTVEQNGASERVTPGNYSVAAVAEPGMVFQYWTYDATVAVANGTSNVTGDGTIGAVFGPVQGSGRPTPSSMTAIYALAALGAMAATAVGVGVLRTRRNRERGPTPVDLPRSSEEGPE